MEIRPEFNGKHVTFDPFACFGTEYYCLPEVGWPEACNAGRSCGPVAPEGHPKRVQWEQAFMEQPCAFFSYESSSHMSFDTFYMIGGVNQNHPRNVEICGQEQFGDDPSWVKVDGFLQAGQWAQASVHGDGRVCAEARDGAGRHCVRYEEQ